MALFDKCRKINISRKYGFTAFYFIRYAMSFWNDLVSLAFYEVVYLNKKHYRLMVAINTSFGFKFRK